jgi:hypothetical protein
VPLSAAGVNLAGKPAKLGGKVAAVVGWSVLGVSLAIALVVGALLQAIFAGAFIGWTVGLVIAAMGGAAAWALLMGGKFLQKTGDRAAVDARRGAVRALAENQKGILRVPMVAQALGLKPAEAETLLTDMAKDPETGMTLEIDADGKLYFRVLELATEAPWPPPGVTLGAPANAGPVRVQTAAGPRVGGDARPKTELGLGEPLTTDEDAEEGAHGTKRARELP